MPRTLLPSIEIENPGVEMALTAANVDGDAIDSGRVILVVTNGGGAPITVTAVTTATTYGFEVEDSETVIANGDTAIIGPFEPTVFNQPTGSAFPGKVFVNYSAVTSVTRGAFKL